jgi:hypothetical protein
MDEVLPERLLLEKIVELGTHFLSASIGADDFAARRDAFSTALDGAATYLVTTKSPRVVRRTMTVDGCMGPQEVLVEELKR